MRYPFIIRHRNSLTITDSPIQTLLKQSFTPMQASSNKRRITTYATIEKVCEREIPSSKNSSHQGIMIFKHTLTLLVWRPECSGNQAPHPTSVYTFYSKISNAYSSFFGDLPHHAIFLISLHKLIGNLNMLTGHVGMVWMIALIKTSLSPVKKNLSCQSLTLLLTRPLVWEKTFFSFLLIDEDNPKYHAWQDTNSSSKSSFKLLETAWLVRRGTARADLKKKKD